MQMFDLQLSATPEFYLDSDNIKGVFGECFQTTIFSF